MSEYQYYEFQAVDRPLTDDELRQVRAASTRATITPTRFVNVYNYGDFRGSPSDWMEKWFDAHLYLANWGTRELMLRLPRRLLDPDVAQRYCRGPFASAAVHGDHVILSFTSEHEDGDWEDDGSGWLTSILPVRDAIAGGDHRALYLAWLLCVQDELLDEDDEDEDDEDEDDEDEDAPEPEPPVPPGLGKLTGALRAFADFLRIDEDLIAAAAERSAEADEGVGEEEIAGWIAALPEAGKTAFLVRVASGEANAVRMEILRGARDARRTEPVAPPQPRTAAELLAAAEQRADRRRRAEAERAAREKAKREREAAEARERHLDALATRQEEAWRQIDSLITTKVPAKYDEAVNLLRDLRDLAARDGRAAEAEARIQALRDQHARKPSFLERLDRKMKAKS